MIVDLAGCSVEDAERVYKEVQNIPEALNILMPKSVSKSNKYIEKLKPKTEVTEEQKWCRAVRDVLKTMDDKRPTAANQREPEERSEHCILREETAQQNSYFQECQLPSHQSEVQKQETVCQLPSECSSDSQSTAQT